MKLHEFPEIFNDSIQATADVKNIREIYIEKDYWVTLALHIIFHSEYKDDVMSYRSGTDWLSEHPKTALIYSEPENTWEQLRGTYNSTFKDLVFGILPSEADMITTLKRIFQRLYKISWQLEEK